MTLFASKETGIEDDIDDDDDVEKDLDLDDGDVIDGHMQSVNIDNALITPEGAVI